MEASSRSSTRAWAAAGGSRRPRTSWGGVGARAGRRCGCVPHHISDVAHKPFPFAHPLVLNCPVPGRPWLHGRRYTRPAESAKLRARRVTTQRRDTTRAPSSTRRAAAAAISGVAALAMVAAATAPAQRRDPASPANRRSRCRSTTARQAEPTIRPSRRVYANTTPDGTPVYIYVPAGTPLDGSAPDGRREPRPRVRPRPPLTNSCPAPITDVERLRRSLRRRSTTWATSSPNQIVAVDEEHFGEMDAADPAEPASDSLVMVVYNVQDDELLRLRGDDLHGRLLRPGLTSTSSGMNVDRHRRVRLGEPRRARRLAEWNDEDASNDQPDPLRGRHRARARAPAA